MISLMDRELSRIRHTAWAVSYTHLDVYKRQVLGSWKKFKDKEISRDTLISYGYGDGGGGVNRDMLKMRRAMDRLPGLPAVKTGKAGEFFDLLPERMDAAGEQAAVWDGELYLEYHRGCLLYTSRCV